MHITNVHGLPEPLVKACEFFNKRELVADFSVTELLKSPYQLRLERLHADETESDVSERLWSILGSAVHKILEEGAGEKSHAEKKVIMELGGKQISGTPDHLCDGVLQDWKVCAAYKIILGNTEEWEQQLNAYKYMLAFEGQKVDKIEVIAIIRDWNRREAQRSADYPQLPVITIPIKTWSIDEAEEFLLDRISLHTDPVALPCEPRERWSRPTTWAVQKVGAKRATRVFNDKFDAEKYLNSTDRPGMPEMEIVERQGEDVKCEFFCPVNKWCDYYKKSSLALGRGVQ